MKTVAAVIFTLLSISAFSQVAKVTKCPGDKCASMAMAMRECGLERGMRPDDIYFVSRDDKNQKIGCYELDCLGTGTGTVAGAKSVGRVTLSFCENDGGSNLKVAKLRSEGSGRRPRPEEARPTRVEDKEGCVLNEADHFFADCKLKDEKNVSGALICQGDEYVRIKVRENDNLQSKERNGGKIDYVSKQCEGTGGTYTYKNDQNRCECPTGKLKYDFTCSFSNDGEGSNAKTLNYYFPLCKVKVSGTVAFLKNCLLSSDKEYVSCPTSVYKRKAESVKVKDSDREAGKRKEDVNSSEDDRQVRPDAQAE